MDDEYDRIAPQSQRLQTQLAVSITPIFAGDREPCKDGCTPDEVKAMVPDIAQALGLIKGDHEQIVDAILDQCK